MFYVDKYGGDQLYYYFKHESLEEFYSTIKERKNIFRPGRNFINIITIFLKTKLFLSYESVVLIYSSLGLIGTLLLFSSWQIFIKNQNYSNYYIVLILIFLPSLTFWTSSIGKDPICFLARARQDALDIAVPVEVNGLLANPNLAPLRQQSPSAIAVGRVRLQDRRLLSPNPP